VEVLYTLIVSFPNSTKHTHLSQVGRFCRIRPGKKAYFQRGSKLGGVCIGLVVNPMPHPKISLGSIIIIIIKEPLTVLAEYLIASLK
jgi:hypothetical protein